MDDDTLADLAKRVGEGLLRNGRMVACAESCTGGWIAKVLTDVAGSSAWLERGFVVYSNQAKQEMLGVLPETLAAHGAVSEPVALEMARGALARSRAQMTVAVTGIAGPGGGSPEKPVGTVWLAWATAHGGADARRVQLSGGRAAVRQQTVRLALEGLLERLS